MLCGFYLRFTLSYRGVEDFTDRRCDRDGLKQFLFLFGGGRSGGAFADDLQHSVIIFGAVIMDLLAEMRDKAACRYQHRGLGIEFDPSATFDPSIPGPIS